MQSSFSQQRGHFAMGKEIMPDEDLCWQRMMRGSDRRVLLTVGSSLDQLCCGLAI